MGLKIVIPDVQFPTSQLVQIDPILVGHSGGLILYERGHPYLDDLVTVPVNAGVSTNLASVSCNSMTGGSGDGAWDISDLTGGKALLERSTKGGIHYVTSRTLGTTGHHARIALPDAIKTYLRGTGDSHHYYVSTWARKTRVEVSNANSMLHALTATSAPSTNYIYYQTEAGSGGAGGGGTVSGMNRSLGNQRAAVHGTGWAGTEPANNGAVNAIAFGHGATILSATAITVANWVIYRCYIEDLTVSGRSHTAVDALDLAEHTKQVLTAGGRYYGDTYTDPATVT